MYPQQPQDQQPEVPPAPSNPAPQMPVSPSQQPSPSTTPEQAVAPRRHKKLALLLLILPTLLFILALACGIIASSQGAAPQNGEVFAEVSPLTRTFNILGFLLGLIGFLTWLPGIILG